MTRRALLAALAGLAALRPRSALAGVASYWPRFEAVKPDFPSAPRTCARLTTLPCVERPLLSSLQNQSGKLDTLLRTYKTLAQKSLSNPKDTTGLLMEAKVHNYYCAEDSMDVHQNWAFLLWHRGFLYFHERKLAAIAGPDFRLPVWDWENFSSHDAQSCATPAPWMNDGIAKTFVSFAGHEKKLDFAVDTCTLQAWLVSKSFEDFAGFEGRPGCAMGGVHDRVHTDLFGAMRLLKTAAADPIFYAHHANVDRYWQYWQTELGFHPPQGFRDQKFWFYDETGQPVYVCAEQLLDPALLGYRYQSPVAPIKGLEQAPGVSLTTLEDFLRTFAGAGVSLLGEDDRRKLLSGLPANVSPLDRRLDLLLNASRALRAIPFKVPARIDLGMSADSVKPGKRYALELRAGHRKLRIGTFGTLMRHAHNSDCMATSCLGPDALSFLIENRGSVQLALVGLDRGWAIFDRPVYALTAKFGVIRNGLIVKQLPEYLQ